MLYYYQKYEGLVHDLPYDIKIAKDNGQPTKDLEDRLKRAKILKKFYKEICYGGNNS